MRTGRAAVWLPGPPYGPSLRAEPASTVPYELPVVAAPVVVVVQRNGLARTGTKHVAVVELAVLGVPGHRVHRRARLLGGLDPDVAVPVDTGTGRDELADDDVLLQTDQRVALGLDGRVGEHPRRLLERRRGQPRLGGQRGLGYTHQHRTTRGRVAALGHHPTVGRLED